MTKRFLAINAIHAILAILAAFFMGAAAQAAAPPATGFPTKPIRFIVPYPPGGAPDLLARAIGSKLSADWGQQVLVDNRPGANGVIATELTARAAGDGYTLFMGSVATHAINPALYASAKFDPLKEFTFITKVGYTPLLITAHPSVQASDPRSLIALARSQPGKLAYGTSGSGSAGHLAGEMFKAAAGIDLTHVPYKGMAQASVDLVAGQIQLTVGNILNVLPHIKAGKLKAIGVTGTRRAGVLPDTPAIAEVLPGFDVTLWWGVMGPAGIPAPALKQLNEGIAQALSQPELREQWAREGSVIETSTPQALRELVIADRKRWGDVVKASGARAD